MLEIYKLYCIKDSKIYAVPAENSSDAINKLSKTLGVSRAYIKEIGDLKKSLRKNKGSAKNIVRTSVR